MSPFGGTWSTTRGAGRRLVVAVAVVLAITAPVNADGGLTGAVARAYFPRTIDASLHSIAHQRVLEISACPTCMTHNLMRAGTSEVLAFNLGSADPMGDAVRGWQGSAAHNGILSNGSLGSIGCAQSLVGGTSYFACVLAAVGATVVLAPATAAPEASPQLVLPDTATPRLATAAVPGH